MNTAPSTIQGMKEKKNIVLCDSEHFSFDFFIDPRLDTLYEASFSEAVTLVLFRNPTRKSFAQSGELDRIKFHIALIFKIFIF